MLRKLFKYDFLAIGKTMWLLTIIVALTTAAGTVAGSFIPEVGEKLDSSEATVTVLAEIALMMLLGTIILISFMAVAAYVVLSIIMITKRYYSNLFTDEGYLTFTLPVKTSSILNAKILAGALWAAVSTIITLVCFLILFSGLVGFENIDYSIDAFSDFYYFTIEGLDIPSYHYVLFLVEYGVTLICGFMLSILLLYLCVTVASVIARRARVILGIGLYMGVMSVISTIVQTVTTIIPLMFTDTEYVYSTDIEVIGNLHFSMCFTIVVYGSVAVASYFINRYLLKNKLNLI